MHVQNRGTAARVVRGQRRRPRPRPAGAPARRRRSGGPHALAVEPPRLVVAPGQTATLAVRARRVAGPGDHPALVLLTARSAGGAGIGVRVRIGVAVEVRVPGVVHRTPRARRARVPAAARSRSRCRTAATSRSGSAAAILVGQVWLRGGSSPSFRRGRETLLPRGRGLVGSCCHVGCTGEPRVTLAAPRLPARAEELLWWRSDAVGKIQGWRPPSRGSTPRPSAWREELYDAVPERAG